MSINKVVLTGNLTKDIEVSYTSSGMPVGSFGIAVNERRKNSQGKWEDYPNFIDVTLFGNRAESLSEYLTKGKKVAIDGKLHQSRWENNGQKRSKVEIIVNEIELLSKKPSGNESVIDESVSVYDDEIPF